MAIFLEQGRRYTRVDLAFAAPEREAEFILAIARERLGRLEIGAPVTGLRLVADQLHAFVPRNDSWLPGREERAVGRARLVEKLSARIGAGRVFGIALADDHRPERGWQHASPGTPRIAFDGGPRPAWLLHQPQKLIAHEGVPHLQGELSFLAGPERIETGWWDGEAVQRDYYVAANPAGETLWVYRERCEASAWFLHGVFA
jgi:protein ImuB